MSFIFKYIIIVLLSFFSIGISNTLKAEAIKIPLHQWHSQQVGATIIGMLFEMIGEKIEYSSQDSEGVYESLCKGEIDIVHEIWEGAMGPFFQKKLEEGCVVDLVTHDAKVREGWWYPVYVKDICPDLPDWEALNKCSEKFSTEETEGLKGRFVAGPKFWKKDDTKRIAALRMNFEEINYSSVQEIWDELKKAVENKDPIVIFNWTPNFVEAMYEGEFVKFPAFEQDCIKDESWGINKDLLYDCGNQTGGYIKIGVNKDFKKDHPTAYNVAKKINFNNLDISLMGYYIDGYEDEDLDIETAAERWLDENEERWKVWIE